MLTIHFIRHAQSESNAGLRTEHPATIRLTAKGYQQAELIAQAFEHTPDLIVTSPYLRTRLTAEPLIKRFPEASWVEWPVQEFTYLDPAHWNGTSWQERQPSRRDVLGTARSGLPGWGRRGNLVRVNRQNRNHLAVNPGSRS